MFTTGARGRHGFELRDTEGLRGGHRGEGEYARGVKQDSQPLARNAPEEQHPVCHSAAFDEAPQTARLRSVADDDRRRIDARERLDQHVEAFDLSPEISSKNE